MFRPLPQTVWLKDGRPIQASERVTQGNYGKSLKIKAVDFNDNGTYTCEVSNGVGSAKSYSINLKIRGEVNNSFCDSNNTQTKQHYIIFYYYSRNVLF